MPEEIPCYFFDLQNLPRDQIKEAIESTAAKLQTSFDLQKAPLLCIAYLNTGDLPHRLLIVVHHLAMDGVSWRILLEDLQLAYQQIEQGKDIILPPKTSSFKEWALRLKDYATSEDLQTEIEFWQSIASNQIPEIQVDFPDGENLEKFTIGAYGSLDKQQTEALLKEVPLIYKTEINDIY